MLKKMENREGASTQPCLTPLEIEKLSDREPLSSLALMELTDDGEKAQSGKYLP